VWVCVCVGLVQYRDASSSDRERSKIQITSLIGQQSRNPKLCAAMIVLISLAVKNSLTEHQLDSGKIPAAGTPPDDHWNRIANDDTLMRHLSEPLELGQSRLRCPSPRTQTKILFNRVNLGASMVIDTSEQFCETGWDSTRGRVAMDQNAPS
jgi:hypothetical protein